MVLNVEILKYIFIKYQEDYYSVSPELNPLYKNNYNDYEIRGGYWNSVPREFIQKAANRVRQKACSRRNINLDIIRYLNYANQ